MDKPVKEFTVLITDDDEQNRISLTRVLHDITPEIKIDEAFHGESAVEKVTNKIQQTGSSFDLIFMDYKMPIMDGEIATVQIRHKERAASVLPSVIITWSTAKHAAYPEADDWLSKPVHKFELENILSTYGFIEID